MSEQEIGEANKLKHCLRLRLNDVANIGLLMVIATRKEALGENVAPGELHMSWFMFCLLKFAPSMTQGTQRPI